jgi:short-subunit dehydrogenase
MDFAERYGPWAIIAGASEGTGRAFSRHVAAKGLNCLLIARREAPLAELASQIRSEHNVECLTASIDLAAADAADQIALAAGPREIGLFISNAGADPSGAHFLDQPIVNWNELVARNVVTTMRCCHHFGRKMRERGRGGIILVGSGACYGGATALAVYSATKAFDLCFGEGLWAELKPHGVDVLNLILGRTDTPAFRALLASKGLAVPGGLASPDDVAEVGLARLPHGPVHNWGLQDDETGYAISSAAARRARVLAVGVAASSVMKGK